MRYVILFVAIAFFLIWDGIYNHSAYLNGFLAWLIGIMRTVGIN
jgi:hypothetical protein